MACCVFVIWRELGFCCELTMQLFSWFSRPVKPLFLSIEACRKDREFPAESDIKALSSAFGDIIQLG